MTHVSSSSYDTCILLLIFNIGARAVIVEAICPTLIGKRGTIVRETAHTLVLACDEMDRDKVKLCQVMCC
jgi:RNase P/RNase MRP subunit p29